MIWMLANATDGSILIWLVVFIVPILLVAYGVGTRCRNPKCRKLFAEKRRDRFIKDTRVEKLDEWIMELTRSIVRERDESHSGPFGYSDQQGRVRDNYMEKVRYEIERTTEFPAYRCSCKYCHAEWILDLPSETTQKKRRIG